MYHQIVSTIACLALGAAAAAQTSSLPLVGPPPPDDPASSSLMVQAVAGQAGQASGALTVDDHGLRQVSMFAIAPPQIRKFQKHDLIQIVVRETSLAKSSHDLKTEKEYGIDGQVKAWPDLRLSDLIDLQINAGRTTNLPKLDVDFNKDFEGKADFERRDDLTARLTAEVIEVLPNGHLLLEARTHIQIDDEEATMMVTGICRAQDVTPANTILSNQIHDLEIEKVHKGELRNATQKGIIAKVLDTIFAF